MRLPSINGGFIPAEQAGSPVGSGFGQTFARLQAETAPRTQPVRGTIEVIATNRVPLAGQPGTYLVSEAGSERVVRSVPVTRLAADLGATSGAALADRLRTRPAAEPGLGGTALPPALLDRIALLDRQGGLAGRAALGWSVTAVLTTDVGRSSASRLPQSTFPTAGLPLDPRLALPPSASTAQASLDIQLLGPGLCLFCTAMPEGLEASLGNAQAVMANGASSGGQGTMRIVMEVDSGPPSPRLSIATAASTLSAPPDIARAFFALLDPGAASA